MREPDPESSDGVCDATNAATPSTSLLSTPQCQQQQQIHRPLLPTDAAGGGCQHGQVDLVTECVHRRTSSAELTGDRPAVSGCSSRCSDRPSSCSGSSRTGDRPLSCSSRPGSCSSRTSDRPGSGRSGMSDKSGGGTVNRSGHLHHSRTSSTSSGDGLLLSVSALARGGRPPSDADAPGTRGCQDAGTEPTGEVNVPSSGAPRPAGSPEGEMGQASARPPEDGGDPPEDGAVGPPSVEREDPEGIDGTDSTGFSSLLSVDKRVFGRLQEELTAAQSELKLKEEEVTRLSRIRDDVEDELQELTASLFQEAHKMVGEANLKAMQAEKALAESNMKVDGLLMEVAALKALVITSTPSKPNLHLHPHIGRKKSAERGVAGGSGSAPGTPTKERLVEGAEEEKKFMDPILRNEYMQWKKLPTMDPDQPFFARIYREDVNPCLEFPNEELGSRVRVSVLQNTLSINPVKDDEDLPRNCSLFEQPRRCTHTLTLGDTDTQSYYICQLARNRIASVCDFVTYCRYVTQGLVKLHCNEVYWQIMERRKNMTVARLGFTEV